MSEDFAAALRAAMASRGLKKRDLARILGLSDTYIGKLANGEQLPSPDTAEKLASALGEPPKRWLTLLDLAKLGDGTGRVREYFQAEVIDESSLNEREAEALRLIRALPPEEQEREIRYLEERARRLEPDELPPESNGE